MEINTRSVTILIDGIRAQFIAIKIHFKLNVPALH